MIAIRAERHEDVNAIRQVNDEAFGGDSESKLIDKLRNRGVLTVSLVAVHDGGIVGHIAFSPATVESASSRFEVIALAPMSVLPPYQRRGIGSQLVRVGLEECRRLGHEIVVVVGHADYYPRFGFVPAAPGGLKCEFEVPGEAWMVLELRKGALAGCSGTVRFQPEFAETV